MSEQNTTSPYIQELVSNKKAFFQYEIIETFEVGIALVGTEIKSLRNHGGSLVEAYITADAELWLIAASIAPYKFGSFYNHEEKRKRKLLAHKREIASIREAVQQKGLTCVPLSMYLKNGKVKVKIALVKGKKLHDKRATIAEREEKRYIQQQMK